MPLVKLREVDLSTNYKLVQKTTNDRKQWPNLLWTSMSFADNTLLNLPNVLLESLNETLNTLDLSRNILIKLDQFPPMDNLETLYLDECSITLFNADAFDQLSNLKHLSIQKNRFISLPEALMVPSLTSLTLSGLEEYDNLDIPDGIFDGMSNLERLCITKFRLIKPLHLETFTGLSNLTSLNLSYSSIEALEDNTFGSVPKLRNLTMAYCSGIDSIPAEALRGPERLEVVDLTHTTIFPADSKSSSIVFAESPLVHIKDLNLRSSLINLEDAMERLGLPNMPSLLVLDIGANKIRGWTTRKFTQNMKLEKVVMSGLQDYISLTAAMIEDFGGLKELDLTQNTFICNDAVVRFFELAEVKKDGPDVIGWGHGFGYSCIEDQESGAMKSFFDYTTEGQQIDPPFPKPDDDEGQVDLTEDDGWTNQKLIGLVGGGLAGAVFIALMVNLTYTNWWHVQFKMAKWKRLKNGPDQDGDEDGYLYDTFVSYSSEDHEWVNGLMTRNLEPGYRLCIHERDFELGRSIVDNIVDCLSKSRHCLIILSNAYVKSDWCNFEAQVAHSMMKDKMATVILEESVTTRSDLTKVLKLLLKTRTYIPWEEKDKRFWRRIGIAIARENEENVSTTSDTTF